MDISIVIPCKNEAKGLSVILPDLVKTYPNAEIIISDDASEDETAEVIQQFNVQHKVRHITRPYSLGNGGAIKAGARAATGDVIVFMDGDGQHRPEDIAALLSKLEEGYDMVVGARDADGQASLPRRMANAFYNRFSSWMVGHCIMDLTSGFRAVRREKFLEFIHLLPNTFSYPTTCTMAFFRAGYPVGYVPVRVEKRIGKSHIRILRDGLRFLIIIFKIGTLFSPLKIFLPVAAFMFACGCGWYAYTFATIGRFTNMSALLFTGSVMVFLLGLISEQITTLMYKGD